MTREEQEVQTTNAFANIITAVARVATVTAGEVCEDKETVDNDTIQLIAAQLQKKLAPYART